MTSIAETPQPPYYAAIFTSVRASEDDSAYAQAAEAMFRLATHQKGFLGMESARGNNGMGISVSYWQSAEAIAIWKIQADHMAAQRLGREKWYGAYTLRIARVEREVSWAR